MSCMAAASIFESVGECLHFDLSQQPSTLFALLKLAKIKLTQSIEPLPHAPES